MYTKSRDIGFHKRVENYPATTREQPVNISYNVQQSRFFNNPSLGSRLGGLSYYWMFDI